MDTLTKIATSIITFINDVLVPLVFAIAFIVFIFGVFRYMIAGAADPEKRKNGTQLILYSVIGFAVMVSVWGLVNLLVGTFGFDSNARPCLPTFSGNCNSGSVTNTTNGEPTNLLPSGYTSPNEPTSTDTGLPGIY
jgi:hypothetical protein